MKSLQSWMPGNSNIKQKIIPTSVQEKIGKKLQAALDNLPAAERDKLAHPLVRSIVADQAGEQLLLHLMTGLNPTKLAQNAYSQDQIHEAFYKTIPSLVRNSPPEKSAKRLVRFLNRQLQNDAALSPAVVEPFLKNTLASLNPLAIAVAEKILQKREALMDMRIDAAKEVGDMNRIRNAPTAQRKQIAAQEELNHVEAFFDEFGKPMKAINHRIKLRPELTEINKLIGEDGQNQWINKVFSKNTFTSMPNMQYGYSQDMQLLSYDQRPDEVGGSQLKPSEFLERAAHPMSRALPATALHQMQNLVSSHDYNTATHSFMVNPALSTMDLLPWWGLKDDFRIACTELQSKSCFAQRVDDLDKKAGSKLGEEGIRGLLEKLSHLVQDQHTGLQDRLSPDIRKFYDQSHKEKAFKTPGYDQHPPPTPKEMKARFVDAVFNALTVAEREELGLPQHPARAKTSELAFENSLKKMLTARIMEPSEAKAMRGVMVNSILSLGGNHNEEDGITGPNFWSHIQEKYALDEDALGRLKGNIEKELYKSLDKTIHGTSSSAAKKTTAWQRHFGYEGPDIVLQNIFKNLTNDWAKSVPAFAKEPEKINTFRDQLKEALYTEMLKPVIPKMLRLLAVQSALPGNPSFYLQDWFLQGGGEYKENIFVQNRGAIRVDKWAKKPTKEPAPFTHDADYQKFIARAKEILEARSRGIEMDDPNHPGKKVRLGPGAFNNGTLLNVPADDENGILPLVRDNGREQVITLVNTGQPQPLDWLHKAGQDGPGYAKIHTTPEPLQDYRTTLSCPELVPGRIYRDAINGERFRLDEEGALVNVKHPDRGIDIADCRILVRELKRLIK
jgi:hypothetical protein